MSTYNLSMSDESFWTGDSTRKSVNTDQKKKKNLHHCKQVTSRLHSESKTGQGSPDPVNARVRTPQRDDLSGRVVCLSPQQQHVVCLSSLRRRRPSGTTAYQSRLISSAVARGTSVERPNFVLRPGEGKRPRAEIFSPRPSELYYTIRS